MLELFIIGAFATYGLAWSIAHMRGPFDLFAKLHDVVGRSRLAWMHDGIDCPICLSFWVGIPVSVVAVGLIPHAAVHWLGYVGFAVFATVGLNKLRGK